MPDTDKPVVRTFRVLAGNHSNKEPDGSVKECKPGDTCESTTDLVAVFGIEKFEEVRERKAKKGKKGEEEEDDQEEHRARHVRQVEAPGGQASQGFQVNSGQGVNPPNDLEMNERRQVKAETAEEAANLVAGKSKDGEKPVLTTPPSQKKEKNTPLESMSLPQLKQLAEDESVDVSKAKNKDEIVKALKAHGH